MSEPKWLTDFDKEVAEAQAKEEAAIRADERRRALRTIHEWAMDREAMGYQQLPFGHLYEKLRREGEQ